MVRAIENLLLQTYKEIELLLIDDGSTDGCFEVMREYARKDSRIQAFHTENRGAGPARNYGIDHASGDYIYFPDADDLVEHRAIALLVQKAEMHNCDLIVFGFQELKGEGKVFHIKKYKYAEFDGEYIRQNYQDYALINSIYGIQGGPCNKFFSMDVIRKFKIRFQNLRRHQDEVFITDYMNHTNKVLFIEDVLYSVYVNDINNVWSKYPFDYFEVVKKLMNHQFSVIMSWNPNNEAVKAILNNLFLVKSINSMRLLFNPKWKLNWNKRYQLINNIGTEVLEKVDLSSISLIGKNAALLQNRQFKLLYIRLFLSVLKEKILSLWIK